MKTRKCKNIVNVGLNDKAKQVLKAELAKRGISYQKLADLLNEQGYKLTKLALDNRMARGAFSADFLFDCLRVIGCEQLAILPKKSSVEDSK